MRKLFTYFLSALILIPAISFSAAAQKKEFKVEESSARNMPAWVNSVERDYLIVTASGGDIEEAKAAVVENVKKQIAQSIATRIVSESSLTTSAYQSGSDFSKTQNLESSILSRTAKLPFIGEISLAKAADYYWERRYYRTSGRYEYFYAVKYPFSEFEMKQLVLEYQEHDRGLNEKLAGYQDGLDFVTSIEEIRQLYDQITIDWFQEKKGVAVVSLSLAGRSISTSQRPQIKSNCASQISSSYEGNTLVIKYNDEYCYEDDQNWIEVRFRAGNKYISGKIYFKNNPMQGSPSSPEERRSRQDATACMYSMTWHQAPTLYRL